MLIVIYSPSSKSWLQITHYLHYTRCECALLRQHKKLIDCCWFEGLQHQCCVLRKNWVFSLFRASAFRCLNSGWIYVAQIGFFLWTLFGENFKEILSSIFIANKLSSEENATSAQNGALGYALIRFFLEKIAKIFKQMTSPHAHTNRLIDFFRFCQPFKRSALHSFGDVWYISSTAFYGNTTRAHTHRSPGCSSKPNCKLPAVTFWSTVLTSMVRTQMSQITHSSIALMWTPHFICLCNNRTFGQHERVEFDGWARIYHIACAIHSFGRIRFIQS